MYDDPEKFLRAVMNDSESDARVRVDAAKALMPFIHARKAPAGAKDVAKPAASGKYAPRAPLKLVNGR